MQNSKWFFEHQQDTLCGYTSHSTRIQTKFLEMSFILESPNASASGKERNTRMFAGFYASNFTWNKFKFLRV